MFGWLAGATAVLVGLTVVPMFRHGAWWIRMGDFPRLQIACVLAAVLVADALWPNSPAPWAWMVPLAAAAALAYQLWWIWPYTRAHAVEVQRVSGEDASRRLRLLTANVLTPNRNAQGLIALIRQHQPDIVVALETDLWWQAQLDALQDEYPHAIKCPLDNLYGMHVYSRLPLEAQEVRYLVEPGIPSIHAVARLPCGVGVRMHFLHPCPPSPTENPDAGERDAELLMVGRSVAQAEPDTPVVVAGDLNDVAWSHTTRLFRRISGLLDPRIGRGFFNTFNACHWYVRWPLDHLFHSPHFGFVALRRLPRFGSDHFAILVEIAYRGDALDHAAPEADAEDHREAREKMAEEGVSPGDVPQPER